MRLCQNKPALRDIDLSFVFTGQYLACQTSLGPHLGECRNCKPAHGAHRTPRRLLRVHEPLFLDNILAPILLDTILDIRYSLLNIEVEMASFAAHLRNPRWTQNPNSAAAGPLTNAARTSQLSRGRPLTCLGAKINWCEEQAGRTTCLDGAAEYRW